MQQSRKTQLAKIKIAQKKFKESHPKVDEALGVYRAATAARKKAEIAKSYKTTTSTRISSIFTTR